MRQSPFQPNPKPPAKPKRRSVSRASAQQREYVRGKLCVNCAGPKPVDAAHLCSRAQGGCDDALCVIPLCRACHRSFDMGQLDLEPVLALPGFALERSHMALHMSFEQCRRRLNGIEGRSERVPAAMPDERCECGSGFGSLYGAGDWWRCSLCHGQVMLVTDEERAELS